MLPSANEYQVFGANALALRANAISDLVSNGMLSNVQFDFNSDKPMLLAQSTVEGNSKPKLGTLANDTLNQSLAHQYDGVAQAALNGVMHGLGHLRDAIKSVGAAANDAAQVAAADARIAVEKVTDPARADVHEAELSKKLHELGHKFEPIAHAISQAHAAMEHNLEDIGAKAEHDPRQYARIITDPTTAIGKAVDQFTGQRPADQIEAIGDQATQILATGFIGKAAEVAGSAFGNRRKI